MCLLEILGWQSLLPCRLCPFQKALVGHILAALTVYLLHKPPADLPFLLHHTLLDEHFLPERIILPEFCTTQTETAQLTFIIDK